MLIGIGYKAGVGKDTVADYLVKRHGFRKVRFADALKDAACRIFGWERRQLESLEFKTTVDEFWGKTPRTLLQRFGTDAMRDTIRKDIWVRSAGRTIYDLLYSGHKVVVSDVRFRNEADAIKDWNGILIRVDRPGWLAPGAESNNKHASEIDLDDYERWDYALSNGATIAQLYNGTEVVWTRICEDLEAKRNGKMADTS